jgi:hypothetical protein
VEKKMRNSHLNRLAVLGMLISTIIIFSSLPANASDVSIISGVQLKSILEHPDIVIIDVRGSTHWRSSNIKIKGAVRRMPKNFDSWARDFPLDKELILY